MNLEDDLNTKLKPGANYDVESINLAYSEEIIEKIANASDEEDYSNINSAYKKKQISSFHSIFMVIFQIVSIAMSLLMISGAGLGVWWGSTSAFAGIKHTPVGGSIGLGFEIVCIIAASAASFWTATTGAPVVWDKSSYVGKMIDIKRLERMTGRKFYLYEASDRINLAETLLHSIAIDIDRFYVMANKLLSSLLYNNTNDKKSNIAAAEFCLTKLCPKEVKPLTEQQKKDDMSIDMIRKLPISVKISLAKYCIGKARKQFSSSHIYQDKKLDAYHNKLLKNINAKLNKETTNLADIEGKIHNLTMRFVKLRSQFIKPESKYDLKLEFHHTIDFSTSMIMTNYFPNNTSASAPVNHNPMKRRFKPSDSETITNKPQKQEAELHVSINAAGEDTPLVNDGKNLTREKSTCRIM